MEQLIRNVEIIQIDDGQRLPLNCIIYIGYFKRAYKASELVVGRQRRIKLIRSAPISLLDVYSI